MQGDVFRGGPQRDDKEALWAVMTVVWRTGAYQGDAFIPVVVRHESSA